MDPQSQILLPSTASATAANRIRNYWTPQQLRINHLLTHSNFENEELQNHRKMHFQQCMTNLFLTISRPAPLSVFGRRFPPFFSKKRIKTSQRGGGRMRRRLFLAIWGATSPPSFSKKGLKYHREGGGGGRIKCCAFVT